MLIAADAGATDASATTAAIVDLSMFFTSLLQFGLKKRPKVIFIGATRLTFQTGFVYHQTVCFPTLFFNFSVPLWHWQIEFQLL
jgi:hypothetical protein